jgi:hypothetical protein
VKQAISASLQAPRREIPLQHWEVGSHCVQCRSWLISPLQFALSAANAPRRPMPAWPCVRPAVRWPRGRVPSGVPTVGPSDWPERQHRHATGQLTALDSREWRGHLHAWLVVLSRVWVGRTRADTRLSSVKTEKRPAAARETRAVLTRLHPEVRSSGVRTPLLSSALTSSGRSRCRPHCELALRPVRADSRHPVTSIEISWSARRKTERTR